MYRLSLEGLPLATPSVRHSHRRGADGVGVLGAPHDSVGQKFLAEGVPGLSRIDFSFVLQLYSTSMLYFSSMLFWVSTLFFTLMLHFTSRLDFSFTLPFTPTQRPHRV